jgi:flavodoxin
MSKKLVTFFSASGVTAKVAKRLADAIQAPLYEIKPEVLYTAEDLDWRNKQSRSTLEMSDKNCRPALADKDAPVADADVIFVGYPVWWYREPSIVDSFLDAYDFTGKKIVIFATSGSSDVGKEAPVRFKEITGAEVDAGKRFPADVTAATLKAWAESL